MMSKEDRAVLDTKLREEIRAAVSSGASPEEVVFLLTRMLPELCEEDHAHGQVMAAFNLNKAKTRFELKEVDAVVDGSDALRVGDRAKLCFLGPRKSEEVPRDGATGQPLPWKFAGENMWVQIEGAAEGRYIGWLRNAPLSIAGKQGDPIVFLAAHVVEYKRAS